MHPTREELSAYLLGTLPEEAAESVSQHLAECSDCEATAENLEVTSDTVVEKLRGGVPADPFAAEAGCQNMISVIRAIGKEPSVDSAVGNVAVASKVTPNLGSVREYQLLTKLGQGGMGAVYKALHTKLQRVVALKVLPSDRMEDPAAVSRFEREMAAVGQLAHPNIVAAHDAGEANGMHYLVMELVDGIDLSNLVRRVGPARSQSHQTLDAPSEIQTLASSATGHRAMTVADACELIRQAAVGLQEAHEHGMVHRDIKPSNLMLSRGRKRRVRETHQPGEGVLHTPYKTRGDDAIVKVLDLGLALLDEGQTPGRELTTTGQMMGTLDYMAPEQGTDTHNVDIRADIYALGATLFRLLTGAPPFSGERYNTAIKMIIALANEQAPSIATMRDDLPAELVGVVDRMLAKNPADRFAEPQEVAAALTPFCEGCDLANLLKIATTEDEETAEDESKVATHESLKSNSVETAPTIDIQSTPHDPREEADNIVGWAPPTEPQATPVGKAHPTNSPASPAQQFLDSIDSTLVVKPHTANPALSPSPRHPLSRSPRLLIPRSPRLLLTAAALAGFILLSAIIFYIKTNHGTIVVEIDDPSISVTVQGEDIQITKNDSGEAYRIKPGEHTLHVKHGDLEFDTDKFGLRRGEEVVLSVRLVDGKVKVVQEDDEQTVIGSKQISTGNQALAFDGESTVVDLPAKFDDAGVITVEAWVNGAEFRRGGNQIWHGLGKHEAGLYVYHGTPRFEHSIELGKTTTYVNSTIRPVTGRWVHLAGVWDGKNVRLYYDGIECSEGTESTTHPIKKPNLNQRLGALVPGRRPGNDSGFHAIIDEVRISSVVRYDKDFTPAERFEPDEHTLALYHFDEGQGEIAHDSSSNKYHGKIVGAKWVKADALRIDSSETPTSAPVPAEIVDFDHSKVKVRSLEPLSPKAITPTSLVQQPPKLEGAVAWTIETTQPRGSVQTAISTDGKMVAAGGEDGVIRIWNAEDGELLHILLSDSGAIWDLAWSPNGTQLACSTNVIQIWDVNAGRVVQTRKDAGGQYSPLAWNSDGGHLAYGGNNNRVMIWDVAEQKVKSQLAGHTAVLTGLCWSPPDDQLASSSFDGTVRVWDVETAKELFVVKEHSGRVNSVSWSPDGSKIISNAYRGGVVISDASNGDELKQIPMSSYGGVVWCPDEDSFIVWNGQAQNWHRWDVEQDQEVCVSEGMSWYIKDLSPSHDGRLVAAGDTRGMVAIYDAETGKVLHHLSSPSRNQINNVAWIPRENRIVLQNVRDPELELIDLTDLSIGRPSGAGTFAVSRDGQTLAYKHGNQLIRIIDLESGKTVADLPGQSGYIAAIDWSPDGTQIVTYAGDTLRVWSVDPPKVIHEIKDVVGPGSSLGWSPSGKYIACAGHRPTRVWNVNGWKLVLELIPGVNGGDMCWNPREDTLAVFDGYHGDLWEADDNRLTRHRFPQGESCAWSKSGDLAAVFHNGHTQIWDMSQNERGNVFPRHASPISFGSFSPSGDILLTWATDGLLWFSDVKSLHPRGVLVPITDDARIAISLDGHYRANEAAESLIRYVVQTESGQQTLTPAEFAEQYGWKNDPEEVKLAD